MIKNYVNTIDEAFLYIADCNLATVSDMAMKKSRKKYEYERQISIAQTMINWIKGFDIKIDNGNRVLDVINKYNGSVKDWAGHFEN